MEQPYDRFFNCLIYLSAEKQHLSHTANLAEELKNRKDVALTGDHYHRKFEALGRLGFLGTPIFNAKVILVRAKR